MLTGILLHAHYTDHLSYYNDWLDAFLTAPNFNISAINIAEPNLSLDTSKKIEQAPIIILHHSLTADSLHFIKPFIQALKNRKGKCVCFVGNEVNLPGLGLGPKISFLKQVQPDFIATQLLLEAGLWLYSECNSKVIALPHALNPKAFYANVEYEDRSLDIGTRSARYGVYVGDNDRNEIIHFFESIAKNKQFKVDLGLSQGSSRFTREQWRSFLNSCKGTIATEAGSFYLEKDDKTVCAIQDYLKNRSNHFVLPNNQSILRSLYRKVLPQKLRTWIAGTLKNRIIEADKLDSESESEFKFIYETFFRSQKTCPVYSKAISSRHFDAAGCKTVQIMFEGRYNDILRSGEHFLALKRDFSNIDEVLSILFDKSKSQEMVNRTYHYLMQNHCYSHRIKTLSEFLE